VAEFENALVGGDEVDDSLRAARFSLARQPSRDFVLGHTGLDGPNRRVYRLGAQRAQRAKAFDLFGQEDGAQASQLAGKVNRVPPCVWPSLPSSSPRVSSASAGFVRATARRGSPALRLEFFFLLDARRLDIGRQDIAPAGVMRSEAAPFVVAC